MDTFELNYDIKGTADYIDYLTKIYQMQGEQYAATFRGNIDSVFDEFEVRSRQAGKQFHETFTEALNGINDEFTKFLTGDKTDWKKMFRGLATGIAKKGLEDSEGFLFSGLNLGTKETAAQKTTEGNVGQTDALHNKYVSALRNLIPGTKEARGSSASNPLFTESVNGVPGAQAVGSGSADSIIPFEPMQQLRMPGVSIPGGQFAGAASKGMGMLNNSDWASSLFGGKLFGSGSFFGGGHALGGDVMGGVPIDVGEHGIERFVPYTNGRIVPNHHLSGTGGPLIGSIDARGTDPALTQANIMRALQATHAQAIRDAARTSADQSRRQAH